MAKDERAEQVRTRIIDRILALCESKRISQSELARHLEVTRQTVGKWFTQREQVPNEGNLLALAQLLGTSVSYLYGETDDPRPAPDWHTGHGPSSAAEAARHQAAGLLREALAKLEGDT